MLFSSNVFLFLFLPAVLVCYYLVPRNVRNFVLLIFSLIFYGWGEPKFLFLMLAVILLNFGFGLWISERKRQGKVANVVLVLGVTLNLLILGWFKYAAFLLTTLAAIIPRMRLWNVPQVELPIGISFYTFQSMSYIIDVYRNDVPVQKNPFTFGTYVVLFPQLIAGPIVRYRDVAEQMENRKENLNDFAYGIRRFIIGLSKKMLLANTMGSFWTLMCEEGGTLTAWAGIIAYALQLYFDFSGYSDMAIGLGKMFGFTFLENFDYPYMSSSVTEFWRRWHISLSTWFKEYVYIPLGGNRRGAARQIVNILIVWGLTGLWHGASWNYVLWGLYYAAFLITEKIFLLRFLKKLPHWAAHVYTMLVIALGWVLFYFEDLSQLNGFLTRLLIPSTITEEGKMLLLSYLPLMVCGILGSTSCLHNLWQRRGTTKVLMVGRDVACLMIFLLCVAALASQSYNPFIYFRF